ncbi:hypothetical protein OPIT5_23815 [Opitutaceae bacterium TAV5]|nr:hypothetical protein OPIT5_23815 [Opitutaceae bacterium TAV5]
MNHLLNADSGRALASTITHWDYVVFVAYLAVSLAIGMCVAGRQKSLKTFLLAGNQMHWALVAISVLSALFSGISFLGAPSETFNHNLVYLWAVIAYFIATPVTALLFLPFFYRLNFYTAYEYLEHRFNLRLRRLSSATFIFRVCLWLSLAIYAPSLVIAEMSGLPVWMAIAITGVCTTLYTAVGGMKAVIYTDVMQFCVLVAGIVAVLCVAIHKMPGGLGEAWQIAEAGGRTRFINASFSLTERMTLWGALFGGAAAALVQMVTDQVSVQRYLSASSLREGQRALWFKLALTLPLLALFFLTGLVLYAFYQTHPEMAATLTVPDRLLPNFVSRQLASPMPGLLVAAILSATMSTVAAGINSLTTATLMDFLYVRKKDAAPAEDLLRVRTARQWTVFYGIVTAVVALGISRLGTFMEASVKIAGFLGGPLLGIFFLGVLSRRVNGSGALAGAVCGFLAVVGVGFFTHVSFMWYALIGCLPTILVGEMCSLFLPAPTSGQARFSLHGRRNAEETGGNNPASTATEETVLLS